MALATPYLMFVGDAPDQLAAKVAIGVVHWRPDWCVGQLRLDGCKADLGIPDMTIEDAVKAGCKTMVIGVANRGGVIPDHWTGVIVQAIEAGMDVAAGLHKKLSDVPAIAEAAKAHGRTLTDARHPSRDFDVASGQARAGHRLLTVGTDVSVGKMFTSLAIEKELKARGAKADFRATGQTGIFIAGDGVSVDAVVADFIAGAAEWLTPANDPDHWDVVEGQGSLFHASYSGVTLGLIHGSRPTALGLGVVVAHHGNVEAALRRHAAVLRAVGDDAADDLRGLRDAAYSIYAPLPHDGVQRAQDLEARLVARAPRQALEQRLDGARGQIVGREAVERVDGRLQRRR